MEIFRFFRARTAAHQQSHAVIAAGDIDHPPIELEPGMDGGGDIGELTSDVEAFATEFRLADQNIVQIDGDDGDIVGTGRPALQSKIAIPG